MKLSMAKVTLNQVEESKNAATFRQEINLIMPQFTVEMEMDVVNNLQKVIRQQFIILLRI